MFPLLGCTILRSPAELALPPRSVVLTFDDGPNPDRRITERLLDVLQEKNVRAAFCLVGKQVADEPEIARRIAREGHWIVNHTFTHGPLWLFSRRTLRNEVQRFDQTVREVLGDPAWQSQYFRPPWGLMNRGVFALLRENGMKLMPVTYYANDALIGPAECHKVVERIMRNARKRGGGVYVIHDGRQKSLPRFRGCERNPRSGFNRDWVPGAAARLIDQLRAEGFAILEPDRL